MSFPVEAKIGLLLCSLGGIFLYLALGPKVYPSRPIIDEVPLGPIVGLIGLALAGAGLFVLMRGLSATKRE